MEDTNIDSPELTLGATDQASEVIETTSTAADSTPTAAPTEAAQPKSLRQVIEENYNAQAQTKPTVKTALPAAAPAPAATAPTTTEAEVDPITGRAIEPIKPPAGMPAGIREKWGSLDRTVQKYWVDRELDIQQTLSKTGTERKLAGEFKEIATPYEPMLRQFGITATEHARELFNLSYSLNNGTPQSRAQILYNLITHFKPDAGTLQALFAGQAPQVAAPAPAPAVNVQAEVDRVLTERAAREEEARVDTAVASFANDPANEFYKDVAPLMAKIIDAELVQGSDLTSLFKEAYALACQRTPEIKQILDQRAAAARPTAPAVRPVPQVKPSLNGGIRSQVPVKPMTAREAAEAAYDRLMGK